MHPQHHTMCMVYDRCGGCDMMKMVWCAPDEQGIFARTRTDMLRFTITLSLFVVGTVVGAQGVAINSNGASPDPSALLDVDAAALVGTKRGLLIPRVSSTERLAIVAPATGLLVFDTTFLEFWFFDGLVWVPLNNGRAWRLSGNAGTTAGTHFLGTTDAVRMDFRVNNDPAGRVDHFFKNTFLGYRSGASMVNAQGNTFLGAHAGEQCTTGPFNTAIGWLSLQDLATGNANIAIGPYSMQHSTAGLSNIGIGTGALRWTTGQHNVAIGASALTNTVAVNGNTAVGSMALYQNTTGVYNTAIGSNAGQQNVTGEYNVAVGQIAGPASAGLRHTTAIGTQSSTHADESTAVGDVSRAEGLRSSALGYFSRAVGQNSTAIGQNALALSANSIALGGTGANAVNVGIGVAAPSATLEVNGYTKLGSNAPAVRMLKLTSNTANVQGGSTAIAHGLSAARILSVSVLVETTAGDLLPALHPVFGYTFYFTVNATNVVVVNQSGSSGSILSRPVRILITYEQ